MLMKLLLLDYESIKKEIPGSLILMALAGFLSMAADQVQGAFLILLLAMAFFLVLMGLNRLLGGAMFGVEGTLHQLLPVSSTIRVASKTLLGGLWLGLILTATLLILATDLEYSGQLDTASIGFVEGTVLYLLAIGFSPALAGMSMAMVPVFLVLISAIFCMGIMMIQIQINSMIFRRFKGLGLLIVTIIAAALFGGLILGLFLLLRKLVILRMAGVWLVAVLFAGLVVMALLFLKCCVRLMDNKVNLS